MRSARPSKPSAGAAPGSAPGAPGAPGAGPDYPCQPQSSHSARSQSAALSPRTCSRALAGRAGRPLSPSPSGRRSGLAGAWPRWARWPDSAPMACEAEQGLGLRASQQARHRQRALLGLLAHDDPKVPGALVVDHPAAAAYCVPGLRSAIVISAGALDLLDQAELAAVLAHERAHLRARHDLVLLPFTALLRAFRWSAVAREANREVALLVEMMADDRAQRRLPARELATALLRVGASGGGRAPTGALAITRGTSPPGMGATATP